MKKFAVICMLLLSVFGIGSGYAGATAQVSQAKSQTVMARSSGVSMHVQKYDDLESFLAADVHWEYEGEDGPEHWGELSPDYALCSDGKQQTPVNIPSSAPTRHTGLTIHYLPSKLNISNNGHTVKVDYDKGSSIDLDGKTYNLLQFHYHAKSEHTINGKYSSLEFHFVNQSADGELAVVGVMVNEGAENAAYASVVANLPATKGDPKTIDGVMVNAADMLPADLSYYSYDGSLTTPPCSEGVKWSLLSTPIELSSAQIKAFDAIYADNFRPIQPLNGRTFRADVVPGMPTTGGGMNDIFIPIAASVLAALTLIACGLMIIRREES